MLITISCWFYTLFLFDTLGDSVGFGGAYWVLVVMPLMPLVMYVLFYAFVRVFPIVVGPELEPQKENGDTNSNNDGTANHTVDLEMSTISPARKSIFKGKTVAEGEQLEENSDAMVSTFTHNVLITRNSLVSL